VPFLNPSEYEQKTSLGCDGEIPWFTMEGSRKRLVMTRGLSLVILIGLIGFATTPYTGLAYPIYPISHVSDYDEYFILSDEFPVYEFEPWFVNKIAIVELTTNGSPVTISLFADYTYEYPSAIIQNVTEIRDVILIGIGEAYYTEPLYQITRFGNESVEVSVKFRYWFEHVSTDLIQLRPSVFLLLVIPLAYITYKNWGFRPDARGLAIMFIILISALLISPFLVYKYNYRDAPVRHELVQEVRTYQFRLNVSSPFIEFEESIGLGDSDSWVRIVNISTNEVLVGITIIPEGVVEGVELETLTNVSSNPLGFELPKENLTEFTVQLRRIAQDTVIDLSIETVGEVWLPNIDPVPYYLSCVVGLALMVITLIFPQKRMVRPSDDIPTMRQS
jgi:hypothetical protein